MCQRKSRMMYLNKTCLPLGLLLHFVSGLRGSVAVDNQGNICPDNRSGRYLLKNWHLVKKKLTFGLKKKIDIWRFKPSIDISHQFPVEWNVKAWRVIYALLNSWKNQPDMCIFDPTIAATDVSRSLSLTTNFRVPV